jgi:hypothetical protein
LIAALAASTADAGPPRGLRFSDGLRVAVLPADDGMIRQGDGGDAAVDVGRLVARCANGDCSRIVVRKRFRLRVDGVRATKFVRVNAFVQLGSRGQRYRVDGRLLSSAPSLVDAVMPLGVAVPHTLEIEILASEPEGVLAETIVWQVEDVR